MPDLPTFTLTDTQAARALAAWGSAAAYREWLASQIRAYVRASERAAALAPAVAAQEAALATIDHSDPLGVDPVFTGTSTVTLPVPVVAGT